MRPTVTGSSGSWDRRAQSSSSTSTDRTRHPPALNARDAALLESRVEKNMRRASSRSSMAVGKKSSTIARTRSDGCPRTSRAGATLPKHVLDAIEEVSLVFFVAGSGFELFLGEHVRELLEELTLFLR